MALTAYTLPTALVPKFAQHPYNHRAQRGGSWTEGTHTVLSKSVLNHFIGNWLQSKALQVAWFVEVTLLWLRTVPAHR